MLVLGTVILASRALIGREGRRKGETELGGGLALAAGGEEAGGGEPFSAAATGETCEAVLGFGGVATFATGLEEEEEEEEEERFSLAAAFLVEAVADDGGVRRWSGREPSRSWTMR